MMGFLNGDSIGTRFSAETRPEDTYQEIATSKNLLVDNCLGPISHFWNGVRFPADGQENGTP